MSRIVAHHDGTLLEVAAARAEDEVEGAAGLVGRGLLDVGGRDVEGRLDLFAGGRHVAGPGDLHEEAHRGDDARRGEQLVGVLARAAPWRTASTNSTVSSSKMSSDCTNTPSSLDDDVSAWSWSRSSITCESWSTHSMGSVWRTSLSSTTMPPMNTARLPKMRHGAILVGRSPELHHEAAELAGAEVLAGGGRLVLADAERGERADDAAQADHRDADGEQQAEVADHRHLGEAQREEGEDGVEGDDEQRRTEVHRPSPGSGARRGRSPPPPRRARASGSRSRCPRRASPAGRRW